MKDTPGPGRAGARAWVEPADSRWGTVQELATALRKLGYHVEHHRLGDVPEGRSVLAIS